jgi:hypothetical protein
MAGFLSNAYPVTTFNVNKPLEVTADRLKKYAFRSNGASSSGWTSFDDIYDTSWQTSEPEKGYYVCFAYRADSGTRSKVVDCAVDTLQGYFYVGSVSNTMLDKIREHFVASFGTEIRELSRGGLESREQSPGRSLEDFMASIYGNATEICHYGNCYTVSAANELEISLDNATVTLSGFPKNILSVLKAGSIKKMQVHLEHQKENQKGDVWKVTLDHNFRFPIMQCPLQPECPAKHQIFERLYSMSQAIGVLHSLYQDHMMTK